MGVRSIGAATRLEDELIHSRKLAQDQVEVVDDLQDALKRLLMLQRVNVPQMAGRLLAGARVVLHGAGAEQRDVHHAERLLAELQIVALHLRLAQLGKRGRILAAHRLRHKIFSRSDSGGDRRLGRWEDLAAAARVRQLHDHGLVPNRRVIIAKLGPAHDSTSVRAATSRSMSAAV
jgi:hypothetical protein